jgi:hypothetical protein
VKQLQKPREKFQLLQAVPVRYPVKLPTKEGNSNMINPLKMGKPSEAGLRRVNFPIGSFAEALRPRGDERMETGKPLSPITVECIERWASPSYKDLLARKKVETTRTTQLSECLKRPFSFALEHILTELFIRAGLPELRAGDKRDKFVKKLVEGTVGDLQDLIDISLAEKEEVQEKVPVHNKKSKVAIA